MLSYKDILTKTMCCLILTGNATATNHLSSNISTALGEKIYLERCKACHGDRGDGKTFAANALFPQPKNFTSKVTKVELTRKRMIRSITQGRPNTAMMPWGNILSDHEIDSVVNSEEPWRGSPATGGISGYLASKRSTNYGK